MSWADWEGIAEAFLNEAGIGAPVDPWLVAWALDLEVKTGPAGVGAFLDDLGATIYVDPNDRLERQGFSVAHECAHSLLRERGLAGTEHACNSLASCLVLPRIDFTRHVKQTGGCLVRLRELNRWASNEAIVRRRVSIDPFVAWVWDVEGPRPGMYSIVTPGVRWPFHEPTRYESAALHEALETRAPAEPLGGVRAWPVIEPGAVRVISLAALDVLGVDV
jgi:hypothetical protein